MKSSVKWTIFFSPDKLSHSKMSWTAPGYNRPIIPEPWHLVKSRFHGINMWTGFAHHKVSIYIVLEHLIYACAQGHGFGSHPEASEFSFACDILNTTWPSFLFVCLLQVTKGETLSWHLVVQYTMLVSEDCLTTCTVDKNCNPRQCI